MSSEVDKLQAPFSIGLILRFVVLLSGISWSCSSETKQVLLSRNEFSPEAIILSMIFASMYVREMVKINKNMNETIKVELGSIALHWISGLSRFKIGIILAFTKYRVEIHILLVRAAWLILEQFYQVLGPSLILILK